jgi:hypothetical protein
MEYNESIFTPKENKLIKVILSGKMEKFRIYSTIILIVVLFLITLYSMYIMKKIDSFHQVTNEHLTTSLAKLQTQTKTEVYLKSLIAEQDKQLLELNNSLIKLVIQMRLYASFFGFVFAVSTLWSWRPYERVIKKLVGRGQDMLKG